MGVGTVENVYDNSMRINLVQSQVASETDDTGSYIMPAFPSSTTTGNCIIVAVCDDSNTNTAITSVTDSYSNTYTKITGANISNVVSITVYYAMNITGGASHTITVTYNNAVMNNSAMVAQEFSGIDTTNALDATAESTGSSRYTSSGATGATTYPYELVFGAVGYLSSLPSAQAGTGFFGFVSSEVTNACCAVERAFNGVLGSTSTATFDMSSTTTYVCVCVTFRANGSFDIDKKLVKNIRPSTFAPGIAR